MKINKGIIACAALCSLLLGATPAPAAPLNLTGTGAAPLLSEGSGLQPVSASRAMPKTIIVAGHTVVSDQAPVVVDGVLMLPVRAIAEAAGAEVQWNADEKSATVHLGAEFGTFMLGRDSAEERRAGVFYIRQNLIKIAHAPIVVHDRMLIPADALTSILGFSERPDSPDTLNLVSTRE